MPPLTEEQFNKARTAGYTVEQIIGFEKQRLAGEQISQPAGPAPLIAGRYTPEQLSGKMIPQITKGLYENMPFGKRIVSMLPNAQTIQEVQAGVPSPQGALPTLSRVAGESAPDLAMSAPFIGGAGAIKGISPLLQLATGMGAYSGTKAGLNEGAGRIAPEAGKSFATTLALGYAGKGLAKGIKASPQTIKNAIQTIKNIPDKLFRGGLSKTEAVRVEAEYGSSNGSLVDVVKTKLKQAISFADESYNKVFRNTPNNKFINIKPAIEESGRRLKRLGLITEQGNLTQLGESEIARDSVYGKLLDFYKSADAISGVENLAGKALTQNQMVRSMKASRETLVNKDQYLFLRDKLNSLYKNKPSDIDVSKVVDTFYQTGENSGLKGLQAARKLEREAFIKSDKFLDNRGDLRIANEAKLNKIGVGKISKQELAHIRELQQYVKHPIIADAAKINRLNNAKNLLSKRKEQLKGVALGVGATAVGMGGLRKLTD